MTVAEGVSARVTYKAYSSAAIVPGTAAVSATDPAATGGQILRRVGCTLSLGKDTYQSAEVRSDRQIGDFRHGMRKAQGAISGELSPGTYGDLFEAVCRGTWTAGSSKSQSTFTSVYATSSTFVVAASTWAAQGFRVGDTITFTGLSEASDNSVNYTITALSTVTATVTPAPTPFSTPDTGFTVAVVGYKLIVPTSSHVSRKYAVEVWNEDLDIARLFTELRFGSAKVSIPATGMATVEFGALGRDMEIYSGASAPFFTAPTAATSTGIAAGATGTMLVNGTASAVITAIDFTIDCSPSTEAVIGSDLPPEIFLGRANVTGNATLLFDSVTNLNYFLNETEVSLYVKANTTSADNTDFVSFYFPRVKFGGGDIPAQGEGAQVISMPFQALLPASATGFDTTTIVIQDSDAT